MNACTLWPDRWGSYDLAAACLVHDEDYAAGNGFFASNWRLFLNVRQSGSAVLAAAMLAGTTVGGWPWYLLAAIRRWLRGGGGGMVMRALMSARFWLWCAALLVLAWYGWTDPDGGAETVARLQWMAWLVVIAAPVYAVRKGLMPGDGKEMYDLAKQGNIAAGLVWLGVAMLTGILFLAFAAKSIAAPPECALPYLPVLQAEVATHWSGAPGLAVLAGQVEQETCPSLTSKKCWNPRTELKTHMEYGFGLGQLTQTAKFDNFAEARKLDVSLRDWRFEDRFDARKQLRTAILMDRGNYRRLAFVADENERLAMALAAYNGGMGGLLSDRRVCAATPGCNPGLWFGHVERTSLKRKAAVKGYGKSFFEINREYVKNIMTFRRARYAAYFGEA